MSLSTILQAATVLLSTAGRGIDDHGAGTRSSSDRLSWHPAYTGLRASTEGDSVIVDPFSPLKLRWAF